MSIGGHPRLGDLINHPADENLLEAWSGAKDQRTALSRLVEEVLRELWAQPSMVLAAVRHAQTAPFGPPVRATLDRLLAHGLRQVGRNSEAVSAYRRSLRASLRTGHRDEAGRTVIGLVYALSLLGDVDSAIKAARQGQDLIDADDHVSRLKLDLNLAYGFLHTGRIAEAKRRYQKAMRRAESLDDRPALGTSRHHLAILASMDGDGGEARRQFGLAREILRQENMVLPALYCEARLALLDLADGNWDRGLKKIESLLGEVAGRGDLRCESLLRYDLASGLTALGAVTEARKQALASFRLVRDQGLGADEAKVACLLGRLNCRSGWFQEATHYLELAIAAFEAQQNTAMKHRVAVELARVYVQTQEFARARPLLDRAQKYLRARDPFGEGAMCDAARGEERLASGNPRGAVSIAEKAFEASKSYPSRLQRPQLAATIAAGYAAQGMNAEVMEWVRRAADELDDVLHQFGDEPLQELALESRHLLTSRLVELTLSSGGEAAADLALDLLVRGRFSPPSAPAPSDAQTRFAIAELRDQVLSNPRVFRSPSTLAKVRKRMQRLAHQLHRQPPALERRDRRHWRSRVDDRSLVVFDGTRHRWRAFVVRKGQPTEAIELPDLPTVLQRDWRGLRHTFRAASASAPHRRDEFLNRTLSDSQARIKNVGRALWEPLALSGRVTVVAGPGLQDLPIEALAPPAVTDCSRLPCPQLLGSSDPSSALTRHALVLHGPTDGGRTEAYTVQKTLQSEGLDVDVSAQRGSLQARKAWDVLHVASHGAADPASWVLTGLELSDGWLGFESFDRARLEGSLIYLSSCQSAGPAVDGARTQGWMTTGLQAGAKEMILTLWDVDDASAESFANRFYEHWLTNGSAPAAVSAARESFRADSPHPFRWAPYIAVG